MHAPNTFSAWLLTSFWVDKRACTSCERWVHGVEGGRVRFPSSVIRNRERRRWKSILSLSKRILKRQAYLLEGGHIGTEHGGNLLRCLLIKLGGRGPAVLRRHTQRLSPGYAPRDPLLRSRSPRDPAPDSGPLSRTPARCLGLGGRAAGKTSLPLLPNKHSCEPGRRETATTKKKTQRFPGGKVWREQDQILEAVWSTKEA